MMLLDAAAIGKGHAEALDHLCCFVDHDQTYMVRVDDDDRNEQRCVPRQLVFQPI